MIDLAHDWYPAECCGGSDCQPVPCISLTITESETYMKYRGDFFLLKMVRPSPDGQCHVCTNRVDRIRCIFVPKATT
jgi:hypothetical protein